MQNIRKMWTTRRRSLCLCVSAREGEEYREEEGKKRLLLCFQCAIITHSVRFDSFTRIFTYFTNDGPTSTLFFSLLKLKEVSIANWMNEMPSFNTWKALVDLTEEKNTFWLVEFFRQLSFLRMNEKLKICLWTDTQSTNNNIRAPKHTLSTHYLQQ